MTIQPLLKSIKKRAFPRDAAGKGGVIKRITERVRPAFGVIYGGIPGLLIGFIAQNPISFAYTSPHRAPQDVFQFQPVLALHLWGKWYLRSAEANWTMGWRRDSPTVLPLSIGLGRTLVRPGLPPMSFFVTGQWTAYRQFAPVAPQTTINLGLTVAFPQLRDYWRR